MNALRSSASPAAPRGERFVIYGEPGTYAAFPILRPLPDSRLAVGLNLSRGHDHYLFGEWCVLVSADGGATWSRTEDPAIPHTWPGSSVRERADRAAEILADGTWLAVGAIGWQAWPADRRGEAEAEGRYVSRWQPPGRPDLIAVGSNTLFVQRSRDRGQSWERREVVLSRAGYTLGFPRHATLNDGSLLLPLRQRANGQGQALVLQVPKGGSRLRLYPIPRDLHGAAGSEAALLEAAPGRVLALMRANANRGGDGRLLCSWSEDGGCTWTFPVVTDIWGYPPHLLKLTDGRILCTYGHRREPLGVQAVISTDGGETWDVPHRAILADDGETTDLGYPISVQLADGSIYTAYYITRGGVTHSLGLRWELPW